MISFELSLLGSLSFSLFLLTRVRVSGLAVIPAQAGLPRQATPLAGQCFSSNLSLGPSLAPKLVPD